MFNKTLWICMLAVGLYACGSEETNALTINCSAGTLLNTTGDACEPSLTEGLLVSATGEIIVDPADVADTAAALAAARTEGHSEGHAEGRTEGHAEGRTEGRAEGAASVTPLNCAEGTAVNEADDACEPTAEYRAAAVEEGRAAGVALVIPLNCAEGTTVNEAGDACEPAAEYRAAAVEEGRAAGVASVTPLNCAEGTAVNEVGDACEPNLSVDVAIDAADTIVPTDVYAGRICVDAGGNFDPETVECSPALLSYGCFRGGFCSEAARLGLEIGPAYAGAQRDVLGCNVTQEGSEMWSVGTELAFRCTQAMDPGSPEWRSFALRLWLCR